MSRILISKDNAGKKLNIKKLIEGSQVSSISGLSLWLKADAGVTYDGSNNVSSWADQSGSSNNATSSGADRPSYVSNVLNSKPIIRFNGTGQKMQLTTNIGGSAYSIFIVCKNNDNTNGSMFLWNTDNNYAKYIGIITASSYNINGRNKFTLSQQDNGSGNSGILAFSNQLANNNFIIGTAIRNGGGKAYLNKNGGENGIGTFSSTQEFNLIGGYPFGYEIDGDIAEIIYYNRALSDAEFQQIETYLNTKYSIYASPYKQNGKLKISKFVYNPESLGDLKVWLDAKDLSTITKDGSNLVSQWSSKVGSINFTQSNNSLKPTYQSAGTSAISKDCIYFNATASYGGSYNLLSSTSSNFTSIGETATLFVVARALYVGPYTNGTIIGQTNGNPYRRRLHMTSSTMFLQGSNGDYNGGNNPNLGEVNHVNQPLVLFGLAINSNGTARHYIKSAGTMTCANGSFGAGVYDFNGTLNRGLIGVAGAASDANMLIGSAFGGGSENLKGEICEILIYNGTLNSTAFNQVVDGLSTKWSL